MTVTLDDLPQVRGSIRENVPLAPYTWLRVGGAADVFFMPKDEADLAHFLSAAPDDIPVHILGAASNTLIRDGGVEGVVVRLGPSFGHIENIGKTKMRAGAAALDKSFANKAAAHGIGGLEFFAGIPGTIGGALRMNAGCYGGETRGRLQIMDVSEMDYAYRHCGAASDLIFLSAEFEGYVDEPSSVQSRIAEITNRREESQPIREKTGGSTFKNPDKVQSAGRGAWQVIDAAGGRGFRVGGLILKDSAKLFARWSKIKRALICTGKLSVLGGAYEREHSCCCA